MCKIFPVIQFFLVTPGIILTYEVSVNIECDNKKLENIPKNQFGRIRFDNWKKLA